MKNSHQKLGYLISENNVYDLLQKTTLIGRSPSCHIVIKHPSISKQHASVEFNTDGIVVLKDLNSMNGSIINGQKMVKGGSKQLENNDQILFGQDACVYKFFDTSMPTQSQQSNENKATSKVILDNQPISLVAKPQSEQQSQVQRPVSPIQNYPRDEKVSLVNQNLDNFASKLQNRQQQYSPRKLKPQNGQIFLLIYLIFKEYSFQAPQPQYSQQPSSDLQFHETNLLKKQLDLITTKKSDLEKQNLMLNEKLLQHEEHTMQKDKTVEQLTKENSMLKEELNKQAAKEKALELYASDLQRKIDEQEISINEQRKFMNQLNAEDWANQLQQANVYTFIYLLTRKLLNQRDNEVKNLQKQFQMFFEANAKNPKQIFFQFFGNIYYSSVHFKQFLEEQSKELTLAKRQVKEYENRNNECNKRWKNLIQENQQKEEEIRSLNLQIKRQIELDIKVDESNKKFLSIIQQEGNEKQAEAAEFLVEQMRIIQLENAEISKENEELHLQMQGVISDFDGLKLELDNYQKLFSHQISDISQTQSGYANEQREQQLFESMKNKLDELEDLVAEMKQKEGVHQTVEYQNLIEKLEKDLAKDQKEKQELLMKLRSEVFSAYKQAKPQIDEEKCIEFFSKLLQDKEAKIKILTQKISVLQAKEIDYRQEIQRLQGKIGQVNENFSGFNFRFYYFIICNRLQRKINKNEQYIQLILNKYFKVSSFWKLIQYSYFFSYQRNCHRFIFLYCFQIIRY